MRGVISMKRCPKCNELKSEHAYKDNGKTTSVCGHCLNGIASLVKKLAETKKGEQK